MLCTFHVLTISSVLQDHVAFKKLLDQKDPAAVEVHAAFSATRNHAAFEAGLLKVVRGSSGDVKPQKAKPALAKQSNPNQQQTQQTPAATNVPKPTTVSKNICRHMRTTGTCKSGSNCKFSHDLAGQIGDAHAAVEPKVAKVPLSKPEKSNNRKNEKPNQLPPNTPPRGSARPVESTPERPTSEAGASTPPRSPAEKAAGTLDTHDSHFILLTLITLYLVQLLRGSLGCSESAAQRPILPPKRPL